MSLATTTQIIASGVQGGHAPATGHETLVIGALIAAMAVALGFVVVYLRRRNRRPKPVNDQWQALAVMGELCPYGWQAQITVYGWGAPVPADAPPARVPLIELEWKQFEEESGRIAVARRVWAPTIGQALQTMVEDRQTDLTLEQIEQQAAEDDLWWSE
jgi:LPXTG-motif cell wall-anchored protein